jgi:hypothetical protein
MKPASPVTPSLTSRISRIRRNCKLAIGPVHVRITTGTAHPVVPWIRGFYLLIIPLTLGFMVLHNLLDWLKKLRSHRRPEFSGQVIFDPLVYPMDTAWLDGKISAGHYRHSRPAYLHALKRAGLLESAREEKTLPLEGPPAAAPPDSQKL